jgi:hypothetical protein
MFQESSSGRCTDQSHKRALFSARRTILDASSPAFIFKENNASPCSRFWHEYAGVPSCLTTPAVRIGTDNVNYRARWTRLAGLAR